MNEKRFFQTDFIMRLMMVLGIFIGVLYGAMILIGKIFPSTMIVAQTYSYQQEKQYINLIDVNRNATIRLDFPVATTRQVALSNDGKRVFITGGDVSNPTLTIWDIFTGKVVNISDQYPNCPPFSPTWLRDNRHVVFSCRANLDGQWTASTNAYDFETGTLKRFSSDVLQTFNYQWSPNLDFIGVDVSHTVHIIEIDTGIEQTITPRGQRQYFIAWSEMGDAVYVYTNRTIERYTLASGEWDVLLADMTISKRPILSPDSTQLTFLSNDKPYVLHISTKNTTPLITNEMDEIEWVGWSPDSAWILLREGVASADGNRYYLAKPDASLITVLAETINAIPTWSSDGRWVSYGMNDEMGKTAYSEVFLQHIADNIPAERVMRYTHTPVWSPYGYDLAFIQYPQLQRLAYLSQTGEVRLLTAENVHVMGFEFLK